MLKRATKSYHWQVLSVGKYDLLINETPEPERLDLRLHESGCMSCMAFSVVTKKRGTTFDGLEQHDDVDYHKIFLHKMFSLGFLNKDNVPQRRQRKLFQMIWSPNALNCVIRCLKVDLTQNCRIFYTTSHFYHSVGYSLAYSNFPL